jgi:hypothetical protein
VGVTIRSRDDSVTISDGKNRTVTIAGRTISSGSGDGIVLNGNNTDLIIRATGSVFS